MQKPISRIGQIPINACYYRTVADGGSTVPMSVVLFDHGLAEVGAFSVADSAILASLKEVVSNADIRRRKLDTARLEPLRNGYSRVVKSDTEM